MTEDNQLANKKRSVTEILSDTYYSLSEAIPGFMVSEKKEFILSVGHLFQAVKRKGFFKQLVEEWNEYREKGKIKDDINPNGPQGDCLQELLEFLDKDCPDEVRFQVMKKIFFIAAAKQGNDRESILPYQYLQICRKMSSGEIVVMLTAYHLLVNKKASPPDDSIYQHNWLVSIANESGLQDIELVDYYADKLAEKNIVHPKNSSGRSGKGQYNRLTGFGYNLCLYINNYDKIFSDQKNS